jgi:hypothetical protein
MEIKTKHIVITVGALLLGWVVYKKWKNPKVVGGESPSGGGGGGAFGDSTRQSVITPFVPYTTPNIIMITPPRPAKSGTVATQGVTPSLYTPPQPASTPITLGTTPISAVTTTKNAEGYMNSEGFYQN